MDPNLKEFMTVLKDGYHRIFIQEWPTMVGGTLVGIMSVIAFTWARPWGVVGGLRVWGDWIFYSLGLYADLPKPFLIDSNSVITLGLIWGALAASLAAGQFAFRVPPPLEFAKALVGGTLLGVGSALAGGCNVGGFYSSISALSLSGFAMMIGLLGGAYAGLKYLYWEMEHLPTGTAPTPPKKRPFIEKLKPFLGWALLLGGVAAFQAYQFEGHVIEGGVLLCGMAFGFILTRSRFCFARAFREPFMTGEAKVTQVVIVSLMISVLGFLVLKWTGLRSETAYVTPNFGLGGLLGGFIFGFGMLMTGGCGSGTTWRACEGQVKLIVALGLFALTNSLAKAVINASATLKTLVGYTVYLPDYLGYGWTLGCIFLALSLWYAIVTWNERTGKLVVDI